MESSALASFSDVTLMAAVFPSARILTVYSWLTVLPVDRLVGLSPDALGVAVLRASTSAWLRLASG